ncbi:hypothetical protein ACFRQM_48845 [Streptomyces sp. NPDC056831]|uniref:hypothetical protein n=1 Tax=Streptomyces sp. NPDC056831 TaxID=3345954 RepID=UPI0036902ACA
MGRGRGQHAERQVTGAGKHAASLRFAESVPFTAAHAVDAMDWRAVDWPVAHAAAIAWDAVKAGELNLSCMRVPALLR